MISRAQLINEAVGRGEGVVGEGGVRGLGQTGRADGHTIRRPIDENFCCA